ncbi:flavodoxin domain-containing protein [Sanguibacter antarcticus]|uniref:Menaquinone-dependent protoporphyrinogen oxidase n=1 Tax=Sanguibacter antarcticus TaxID=372484 RepID=A0A2A9E1N6_9MICO|nr:flavodoxin domain-containing protein [Sanguibacter antarcticus]PFG32764.1 menaquinone-dependent protoporphyrinogen oxidase [Sanguibacter antarcticus]
MRISIAVASKHGSTAEIAAAVGEELAASGHDVSVHDMATASVLELDESGAIILGSAIYYGHWLLPAEVFTEDLSLRLDGRPVWMFSSGPIGAPAQPDPTTVDVEDQLVLTQPREHKVFAGRLERARLHRGERAVATALRSPEGDFRDWEEIRGWARGIARALDDVHSATA